MNRHRLRGDALVFGLLFVAVIGAWAVWNTDLLTAHELALGTAGALIALGLIGIAATLTRGRTRQATTTIDPTPEPKDQTHDTQTPDPQP